MTPGTGHCTSMFSKVGWMSRWERLCVGLGACFPTLRAPPCLFFSRCRITCKGNTSI